MRLVDFHCDTLYKCVTQNIDFNDKSLEIQTDDIKNCSNKLQCYAVWLPDEMSCENAERFFFDAQKQLHNECAKYNVKLIKQSDKISDCFFKYTNTAVLTVENASALNKKISNVKKFAECGVKIITLTWNGQNALGDGAGVKNAKGITKFGRLVVEEMEHNNIVVDISHASDSLFYDVAGIAKKPFVATHSNSRAITNNLRNLTDEQFCKICNCGGIVGINFHNAFLNDTPDKASVFDILKHTEHFMELGGEECVCFGSDFDGGCLPNDICGSKTMSDIYEMFLKHGYSQKTVDGFFYENALKFFENFDI